MESLILGLTASFFMGGVLGLLGGGGSLLTIPILVYLLQVPVVLATSYSLFIVGVTSLVALVHYLKEGRVRFVQGSIFALPSLVGIWLARHYVLPSLPPALSIFGLSVSLDTFILSLFSLVVLLAAFRLLGSNSSHPSVSTSSNRLFLVVFQGLLVGLLTGFIGAGGGFLIVPALVVWVGLSIRDAVGTSLAIIAVNSLFGLGVDLAGQIAMDWSFLFIFSGVSILGAIVGSVSSKRISTTWLKTSFSWFMLCMGVFILFRELVFN